MDAEMPEVVGLLTPAEVAAILYVDRKTVARWASAGKVTSFRTPGGHRRFLKSEISALMTGLHHGPSCEKQRPSSRVVPALFVPAADEGSMLAPDRSESRPRTDDRSAAAAALISEAVATARASEADEAALAVARAGGAVAAAAELASQAASAARTSRALAAATAAEAVAEEAARTALSIQLHAETAAIVIAEAASHAAGLVHEAAVADGRSDASLVAQRLAATVNAAAVAAARDTAAAAARVASAVAAAAAEVARTVAAMDQAIESEVAQVATTLHTVATSTARQVAAAADGRARTIASAAFDAAVVARSSHDGLYPAALEPMAVRRVPAAGVLRW